MKEVEVVRLPKDLIANISTKPRVFLCEVDKTKITQLDTTNLRGSFKFNSTSEISFEVARIYNDLLTGKNLINPFYNKIEALRLIYLEGFGYFELQGPEILGDGIKEIKSCTAISLEYTLAQKYLEDFYVNTGEIGSVEVTYAEDKLGNINNIIPVTLYNPNNKELSLLHLILTKAYGWKIGSVPMSLQNLSRTFEVDRESIYDFIMNELCEKFNCYAVFDTMDNTINLYEESRTAKFVGDGKTNTFMVSPPFSEVGTVAVDGYKTTRYNYNPVTGAVVLEDIPESGTHIEVVDKGLEAWETDVFVTFDNLSQEMNINYSADDIKTVLAITYGEDGSIREANLGLPYITDLSYYYTVDWMGQDLYDAYTAYLQKTNKYQSTYTDNSQEMLEIYNLIDYEENRLSLEYSLVQSVGPETVGTYYIRGGKEPNYYYTEVSLPSEFVADTDYYRTDTTDINEDKVGNLFTVFKKYFNNEEDWQTELGTLLRDFEFMKVHTLDYLSTELAKITKGRTESVAAETAINNFLDEMWNELGRTPLKTLYQTPYTEVQTTNVTAGWSQKDNANYGYYYPVVLLLNSISRAITKRDTIIKTYQEEYNDLVKNNTDISNELIMENNFTEEQLVRLNAFLREDELHLDDILTTSEDSVADTFKVQQDAMEAGRIELNKISQPQLQFSMTMANIYALPEFRPIIDQFQLGNVIKVGLRSDYIKQSRLLQVDINFEDFSDFSVEFGELTSLRTQSDIHADLLSKAISAGKSVAQNSSYWTRGADKSNSIDKRLEEGLLNSIEALKALDGTQNAFMDKYGLHLEAINPATGEIDDKRIWLVNNQIVFTDDGFKTSKSVLGEFTVDGETYYGLLAQAVIAGIVEGSKIKGGTIQIGEYVDDNGTTRYAFEVHKDGTVTMGGGKHTIDGYATTNTVQKIQGQVDDINSNKMYRVEIATEAPTIISKNTDKATMLCRVFSWDSDITDDLDASLFMWKRVSTDSGADTIWNAMPEHQGVKSITIDADDVIENSSFTCEVNLPE